MRTIVLLLVGISWVSIGLEIGPYYSKPQRPVRDEILGHNTVWVRGGLGIWSERDAAPAPEAESLIRKFRRSLMALLETGDKKQEVYQLVVALYPLTQVSLGAKKKKN